MSDRLARCLRQLGSSGLVDHSQPGVREAAVAVVLVPSPDRLLLIRRADRAGDHWSGQVALPGGRREMRDGDLLDTAIRETAEEVGVILDRAQLAGRLDDLGPLTPVLPPLVVRPFIFLLEDTPDLHLNGEVAAAEWVELAEITASGVRGVRRFLVAGTERPMAGFDLPIGFLWGMTERILSPLLSAWSDS